MAAANPLRHFDSLLVRLIQRVRQEFIARANVRYQEAELQREIYRFMSAVCREHLQCVPVGCCLAYC